MQIFAVRQTNPWLIFQYIWELYICVKVFVLPSIIYLGSIYILHAKLFWHSGFNTFKLFWISLQKSKSWIYALQCCNRNLLSHLACLRSQFILGIFNFSGKFCSFLVTFSSFSKLAINNINQVSGKNELC